MSKIAETNEEPAAAKPKADEEDSKPDSKPDPKPDPKPESKAESKPDAKLPSEPKHPRHQVLEFETKSGAGTVALGRKLADLLTPPRLMILSGDLGAGKTTLVKGIAAALGAAEADEVTSPTFTLVHEYSGTQNGKPDGVPVKLLHLDLYRLDTERQLEPLGIEEMQTPDAVVLIEWGEKFKSIKKRANGEITITSAGGDARKVTVTLN